MSNWWEFFRLLLVMSAVTYLIRLLPLLLVKRKIKNRFLLSFLHYIPYTVLAAMTLPGALYATGDIPSAVAALAVALSLSFFDRGLIVVALASTVAAMLVSLIFI